MIAKPLESITRDDIHGLIDNSVPEGRTIEYKKVVPGTSDGDKVKFLRAVSGMANTDGGDLIYGIDAPDGLPLSTAGISLLEVDAIILRFESMLQNCVEPRIPNIAMRGVPIGDGNCVLIVRSRRSWLLPHRIVVGAHAQFYGRGVASTFQMDVSQLRDAFQFSDQQADRIRAFVVDRLLKIEQNRASVPLLTGAKMVLHVLPLSSLSRNNNQQLTVPKMERTDFPLFIQGSRSQKPNLEGFVICDSRTGKCELYTQVFRSGAVEAVMVFEEKQTGEKSLPSSWIEGPVMQTLESIVQHLRKREVSAPYVVNLSFLGVQGYSLLVSRYIAQLPNPYSEPILILPETMIENSESFKSWEIIRPVLDSLWNAFGYEGSPNYDEQGNWREP
jgi:hypothetical protein